MRSLLKGGLCTEWVSVTSMPQSSVIFGTYLLCGLCTEVFFRRWSSIKGFTLAFKFHFPFPVSISTVSNCPQVSYQNKNPAYFESILYMPLFKMTFNLAELSTGWFLTKLNSLLDWMIFNLTTVYWITFNLAQFSTGWLTKLYRTIFT